MLDTDYLRSYLGLLDEDETDDSLLETLEAQAVADFERETNRYVGDTATLVEILSGGRRGITSLRLKAPLISLTSVEYLGSPWVSTSWQAVYAASAYTWTLADGLYLIDGAAFPLGTGNIRVTYQGGYASPDDVPADIRGEIAERVALAYRRRPSATPVVLEPGQQVAQPAGSRSSRAAQYYRNPGL